MFRAACGRAGQADYGVFAGDVCGLTRETGDAALRRGVDDGSSALNEHLTDFVAHAVPYAFQVDGHGAVELLVRNLGHRALRSLDPCIVQCGIQTAVLGDDPVDHFAYGMRVGNIAAVGSRLQTFCVQGCGLFGRRVDVGHDDAGSVSGKCRGTGQTDTLGGAGHQNDLMLLVSILIHRVVGY